MVKNKTKTSEKDHWINHPESWYPITCNFTLNVKINKEVFEKWASEYEELEKKKNFRRFVEEKQK